MKNTGGPAFPYYCADPQRPELSTGMTLRQWYAGMVLQGLCANSAYVEGLEKMELLARYRLMAASALAHADALLAEEAKDD